MADPLTPRQRETLRLYALLGDRAAVAREMGVSRLTVRNQLWLAYQRLDVTSSSQAYRALGWLEVPDA